MIAELNTGHAYARQAATRRNWLVDRPHRFFGADLLPATTAASSAYRVDRILAGDGIDLQARSHRSNRVSASRSVITFSAVGGHGLPRPVSRR